MAEQSVFEKAVEAGEKTKGIVSEAARTSKAAREGLIVLGKNAPKFASRAWLGINVILLGCDIHDWFFGPVPNVGNDGNNVVGG
ncbi:hypothetical protein [Thermococcus sp.]